MWNAVRIELPRRIRAFTRRRGLDRAVGSDLTSACLDAIETNVVILDEAVYAALEQDARDRSLRDPADWPVVATALALAADIWTNDNDFLGTGVATWTIDTLQRWLEPADLSAGRTPTATTGPKGGFPSGVAMP